MKTACSFSQSPWLQFVHQSQRWPLIVTVEGRHSCIGAPSCNAMREDTCFLHIQRLTELFGNLRSTVLAFQAPQRPCEKNEVLQLFNALALPGGPGRGNSRWHSPRRWSKGAASRSASGTSRKAAPRKNDTARATWSTWACGLVIFLGVRDI